MKRVFTFVLAAMMVMTMFGCGKQELPTEGVVGDTLKSDMVEVTLTKFGFAEEGVTVDEEGDMELFCTPIPFPYQLTGNEMMDNLTLQLSQNLYVRKTEAKCVPYLEFTVKITSEEMVKQSVMPIVHFGDSSYSCNGISATVLADYFNGQYDGAYFAKGAQKWNGMPTFWSAGEEYTCRAVLKIPAEVEQNTDTPLTVTFGVPGSEGAVTLTYTIR